MAKRALSKAQLLVALAKDFPNVDAVDGTKFYGTERACIWSREDKSKVQDGLWAYRPYGTPGGYKSHVQIALYDWLDARGWEPQYQQVGCQFWPKTFNHTRV
jgi:hypothetical protein